MIEIKNLTKRFGRLKAINNLSLTINNASIYGLVGSNGAGKSTLLRILSGVYRADEGIVSIDGQDPFDNEEIKGKTIFVSDYPYFSSTATLDSLSKFYKDFYPGWSDEKFAYFKTLFPISSTAKINQMSKGMQRQAAIILGLAAMPQYIFFDEIFDGLDPVIRELVKKLLIQFVEENNATIVIASHNLRELEDVCDHVGLIHFGGALFENDIDKLRLNITRVQLALENPSDFEPVKEQIRILKTTVTGKMIEFTARGEKDEIIRVLQALDPIFYEVLPLTLEEVFISEMEAAGYEINKLV